MGRAVGGACRAGDGCVSFSLDAKAGDGGAPGDGGGAAVEDVSASLARVNAVRTWSIQEEDMLEQSLRIHGLT